MENEPLHDVVFRHSKNVTDLVDFAYFDAHKECCTAVGYLLASRVGRVAFSILLRESPEDLDLLEIVFGYSSTEESLLDME